MADNDWDLVKGLLVGGLIGAALGILFAPKSGRETREDLAGKAEEVLAKAKQEYAVAAEKSKAAYEAAVEKLKNAEGTAEEKIAGLAQTGIEALEENKNRLKRAIDAGVDAYHEEKNKGTV